MYHSGTSQIVNHSSYHYNMWSVVSKELNINYAAVVVAFMFENSHE